MTEELWCELGYVASIHLEKFPIADPAHSKDEERVIAVQIDGKHEIPSPYRKTRTIKQ